MIELKDYIFARLNRVDCHVLFEGKNKLEEGYPAFAEDSILFVDNDIKNKNESLIPYFDKISDNLELGCKYHIAYIGKDLEETKWLVKHRAVEFLGEVKCFKHYTDSEGVERTHEDFSIAMCEDFRDIAMFIHLDLIDERSVHFLKQILEMNPDRPVILCHCGMNSLDDREKAFKYAVDLQHKYNNLWLEISWSWAWDYISTDHSKMSLIDTDRLLLGTDLSKFDPTEEYQKVLHDFDYWSKKMNIRRNVNKIIQKEGFVFPIGKSLYN